jgi:hypothetical protein
MEKKEIDPDWRLGTGLYAAIPLYLILMLHVEPDLYRPLSMVDGFAGFGLCYLVGFCAARATAIVEQLRRGETPMKARWDWIVPLVGLIAGGTGSCRSSA